MIRAIRSTFDVVRTQQIHAREAFNIWTEVPGLFDAEPIFKFGQFVLYPPELGGGYNTEPIFEFGYFQMLEEEALEIILFPEAGDSSLVLGVYDGDTIVPTIPFYYYILGTRRELTVRLWWNKGFPDGEDLYGLSMACEPTGATLPEGSEMAQYFIAGLGPTGYIPTGLDLGYMDADSYKDVTIGFHAPITVETRGQAMLVLSFLADGGPTMIGGSFLGTGSNFGWTVSPLNRIINGFDLLVPLYVVHPDDVPPGVEETTGRGHIEWRESLDDGVSR